MARETLAPWAEVVPLSGKMTVEQLRALPGDDGWQYELADERLVRISARGGEASVIAARLLIALGGFVEANALGSVTGADGTFDLTQPGAADETALVPDVAFVRANRVPPRSSPEYARAWRLAPDLVAEVVSPGQFRPEMADKAQRYLAAGIRLIWMVWPKQQQVDVWQQGTDQPVATLTSTDVSDGLDVVRGFTHPVASLIR